MISLVSYNQQCIISHHLKNHRCYISERFELGILLNWCEGFFVCGYKVMDDALFYDPSLLFNNLEEGLRLCIVCGELEILLWFLNN